VISIISSANVSAGSRVLTGGYHRSVVIFVCRPKMMRL
jgi:hypothetical protein